MKRVDVRATRVGAGLTTALAGAGTVAQNPWLAAALAVILLANALLGARASLWGWLHRNLVASRISPPASAQLEPEAAPRFANLLGGLMAAGAATALWFGLALPGALLLGTVAALALLNAAAGFCLGCRLYGLLVLQRSHARIPGAAK